jgi:2-polyprenyl-6-methoxyphenol hydroxylase-like FAD-dependent oxidoreductase
MAIEDGAVLTRALESAASIGEALEQYQEIRASFAQRNEGSDRNTWLYSYNPPTVALS